MIEPDPVRLEIGRRNFVLNGKQVLFVQAFIDSFFQQRVGVGTKKISRDAFLEENRIEHVDLLHADVEFHEPGVLGAAKAAIRDKKIDKQTATGPAFTSFILPAER